MAVLRHVANGNEATKNYLTADEQNSEFGRRSLKNDYLEQMFSSETVGSGSFYVAVKPFPILLYT